jgi:hypothetical protein
LRPTSRPWPVQRIPAAGRTCLIAPIGSMSAGANGVGADSFARGSR